jgi:hypothetical protein
MMGMESHELAHPKKAAFLAAFALTGNVTDACKLSEVPRRTHYDWLTADGGYVEAFAEAKKEAIDHLEREAVRRAVEGVEEPVFYQGMVCGAIRKYSDTLLIFLLKGANPQKYAQFEGGTTINVDKAVLVVRGDCWENL